MRQEACEARGRSTDGRSRNIAPITYVLSCACLLASLPPASVLTPAPHAHDSHPRRLTSSRTVSRKRTARSAIVSRRSTAAGGKPSRRASRSSVFPRIPVSGLFTSCRRISPKSPDSASFGNWIVPVARSAIRTRRSSMPATIGRNCSGAGHKIHRAGNNQERHAVCFSGSRRHYDGRIFGEQSDRRFQRFIAVGECRSRIRPETLLPERCGRFACAPARRCRRPACGCGLRTRQVPRCIARAVAGSPLMIKMVRLVEFISFLPFDSSPAARDCLRSRTAGCFVFLNRRKGLADSLLQLIHQKRFCQVRQAAGLQEFQRARPHRVSGNKQKFVLHGIRPAHQRAIQARPIHIRHLQIANHQRIVLFLEPAERRAAVQQDIDAMPSSVIHVRNQFRDCRLVLHDQNMLLRRRPIQQPGAASTAAARGGRRRLFAREIEFRIRQARAAPRVSVAPRPCRLSTLTSPPCSCTIPYTMESPRPVPTPAGLVVKNGSKMRDTISGGMPGPSSDTSSRQAVSREAPRANAEYGPCGAPRRAPITMACSAFTIRFSTAC